MSGINNPTQKLRGLRRCHHRIETWKNHYLHIDLASLLPQAGNRFFAKIDVAPWNRLYVGNRRFAEPQGKCRQHILAGLLAIFSAWEQQLVTLNKPFSLQLWLFEPRFSRSQVVCAVENQIDFYQHTFELSEQPKRFPYHGYEPFVERLRQFQWKNGGDEEYLDDEQFAELPDSFIKQKSYRIVSSKSPLYAISYGNVWMGTSKSH